MRLLGLLVLLFACFAQSHAIFRSSSSRGMTSIDENSGDVIWVPIPNVQEDGPRKCLFCRGRMK